MLERQERIEELRVQVEQTARNYFRQGLNCAECVFKSFLDLDLTEFPSKTVALASGFGGGIGLTKNTCGAVLGAALSIGTTHGRKDPLAKETVKERIAELNDDDGVYARFRRFIEEVEAKYGSVKCSELTKVYDWHEKPRKKNCQEIIGYAAGLAVKYALED